MKKYIIALTTCSEDQSEQLARILVEKQVCACVNRISGVQSTYHWKGKIMTDQETLLIMKTEAGLEDALKDTIKDHHPYETPEFVVLEIISGTNDYLDWISASLSQ